MARSAKEIYEVAKQNRMKTLQRSYRLLRDKCVEAVTNMMKEGEFSTEIELNDSDMEGLVALTKEIREFGYYYCLIEIQDTEGNILKHKLRISIAHFERYQ